MTTAYTSLLGLALPVTGELSGTWGDTVNDYITKYVDAAVAGAQTISGSQTAVTLSTTNGGVLVSAGSGATGSAQYAIINCTGNPAGLLTVTAPAASKVYLILNNTSTSQSVKIVGSGPTTGVTVATAQCALVAWNGSDFELVATTDASKLTGVLATANGGTGLTTFTAANNALYSTSASALTAGTLPVAAGGTGATTLTSNNVILGNGTSAVQFVAPGTNGNILTSNGTTWVSSAAPATGVTSFSAGTTGFTPSTGTTGAVTLAGTLAVANGGTGQTTYTDGQLLIGNTTGNTLTKATLTAGSGVSITNGSGSITIAATSTTSIGLVRAVAINCILP